ncbi:cyclin-domain-containing protein [Ampelomyces quisqualis]|uniref:Cyclin-domain-containing protein n=1 Tax=Ampelomyces quisqualis TaxID=50730 RepID=A0A6A5QR14_AMPQU|nr:cyclin-domain-containing protein [Ampelomyces quisqualis]
MLASSSPTISAPSSPSAAFHVPTRAYHASRRTSTSSSAPSPRFAVGSASRRYDATPTTRPIAIPSPSAALAPPPQSRKRSYVDVGTQYTPPGLPPTYHPPVPAQSAATASDASSRDTVAAAPLAALPTAHTPREATSAGPIATEPPEPALRVDPQPAPPAQNVQPESRGAPKDASSVVVEQDRVPQEETAVLQAPSSPAKRARPQDPNTKVMSLLYETCDVKDLGVLVSDMLMELVRINDEQPLRDGTLTRFHSRAPPGISVRDYLSRLIVHATLSPPIILSMVFYVDKLCAMYPSFTISSLTVHRFLITAATVAAKGLSDSFWTNSLYARVGGVSVRELALLELEFLRRLDWRIVPKPEVLVDYYKGLVERGSGFVMEKEPETAAPQTISNQTINPTGSATGIQTNLSGA